jgi:hypothetical protein
LFSGHSLGRNQTERNHCSNEVGEEKSPKNVANAEPTEGETEYWREANISEAEQSWAKGVEREEQ